MVQLRPVIAVRELPPCCTLLRAELPSIRSLISDKPREEEANILEYLQQGVVGCFFPDMGLARDVLAPGKRIPRQLPVAAVVPNCSSPLLSPSTSIDPSIVLTDGVWLWPSVLAYYVAEYHVLVNPEFHDHAKANHWIIQTAGIQLEDLSFEAFSMGHL